MADSPADVTVALNAIARQAALLCDAPLARVTVAQDGVLRVRAGFAAAGHRRAPARDVPLRRTSIQGRALIERKTLHFADIAPLIDTEFPDARENARSMGFRAVLAVPLIHGDEGLGAMFLYRREPGPFAPDQIALVETFARQAAIALQNVRQFEATREALEQQTATSDILRVISQSPTDVRPVFETIAQAALTLCHAVSATLHTYDGELLRIGALASTTPEGAEAIRAVFPRPASRDNGVTRAVFTRALVQIPDILEDPDYATTESAMAASFRSVLAVPLMKDGQPIGAISVGRPEPGPYPSSQVALLQIFADQAVIAIENVRMFTALDARNRDLAEALEQQTATNEILKVISQSPNDVQPVFDTICQSALRICGAASANVFTHAGELVSLAAMVNVNPEYGDLLRPSFPRRPGREYAATRAILEGDVVAIPDVLADAEYGNAPQSIVGGFRSVVAVPLMRRGEALGAVVVGRPQPGPFPASQVALLQTFADQAVIAIENVRLFSELGARNRDLTEALEQQTATSEILRVISRSQTDVQPVFDTIAASALSLLRASSAIVTMLDGKLVRLAASANATQETAERMRHRYPRPLGRGTATGRAIESRAVAMIPDALADPEYDTANATDQFRSAIAVPLLRDGVPIGAIGIGRDEPGTYDDGEVALLQTFADQAVIAIENVRLFTELGVRNRDLTEALEHQTATSEILRVISSTPTDVQPVFEIIAERAVHLCGADVSVVSRVDGELIQLAAVRGITHEERERLSHVYPLPLDHGSASARAVRSRGVVHLADVLADPDYDAKAAAVGAWRSALAVPMLREGRVIGTIFVGRHAPGLFADAKLELLKTFADQAVIAIQNVRLFTELEARNRDLTEALEQQTATSEILRVISGSPTDVQPVFDTIVNSVLALCRAQFANVFTYDGELIHLAAYVNVHAEYVDVMHKHYPMKPGRATAVARAIATGQVATIEDVLADPDYVFPTASSVSGFRSILAVPLLRDGKAIGGIAIGRPEPGPFPDSQVALLQTFADQAVIAIENVRLFTELGARNRDLTEALEQQTATSEILRVISQSPNDVQPVFDTIASASLKLCAGGTVVVATFDGELIHAAAFANVDPDGADAIRHILPRRPSHDNATARAVLTGEVSMIPDLLADPAYTVAPLSLQAGFRSTLSVPLLRDRTPIGAITVGRPDPGPFSDQHVALLKTFADQAVIAIENVRLFTELEARNRELTTAFERQAATGEVLRVISSSPTDTQPVFDAIVRSAITLCHAQHALIFGFDGEQLLPVAQHSVEPEFAEYWGRNPLRPSRGSVSGRATLERKTMHVHDVLALPDYEHRDAQQFQHYRTVLAVPMLRDDTVVGILTMWRSVVAPFTPQEIELVETFADQAVIAIENVRLFTELEARNGELTEALEQQTATSEILRVISGSPTDVQPVFDSIARSALKLCDAVFSAIFRFDGELIHIGAIANLDSVAAAAFRTAYPSRPHRGGTTQRAILTREVVHMPDVRDDPEYTYGEVAAAAHFRAVLSVPMLRDGVTIGTLSVYRDIAGAFTPTQVELLKTFADQAVIAIENVRLFTELEARNRDLTEALEQQTATSEILRAISGSPTDASPVFAAIANAALKLCAAQSANVVTFDGTLVHVAALAVPEGQDSATIRRHFDTYPRRPSRQTANTRAVLTRSVVMIPDVMKDPDYGAGATAVAAGYRSVLAVPLLRDSAPVGAVTVARPEAGLFPPSQVALLQTFADQAVIAIENVRLFTELEARNRDLTEALEQQTATSEILRAISASQTDVQPVFVAIVNSVLALCDARFSGLYLLEDETLSLAATAGMDSEELAAFAAGYPRRVGPDTVSGLAAMECRVVQTLDLLSDPQFAGAPGTRVGARTVLGVPLQREGRAIGSIGVWRAESKAFSEAQIALLQTFADQAVIAIENVRLFKELQARTAELTRSVSELRALGEVGQAVSSTLNVETVLDTIVARVTQLTGLDGGSIYEYDEAKEEFHLHSANGLPVEVVEALRSAPIRKGEGALGRLATTGQMVEIHDIADERVYQSRVRNALVRIGYRSMLVVPLLRQNVLLGGLVVNRRATGAFDASVVELLKTFATQSAIAIQNARLFREIERKSRELETASRHKSEFLANMSHELRTPLNAIIGFSEVLTERLFGELNDKQAEYVGDITDSGRHLLELINDILDLSKIEAGRMELDASEFDLPRAIGQTLTLVRERAERRGITLSSMIDPGVTTIHGDERKVKQVLLNLLSNALKFTPEGGRIAVEAADLPDRMEVSVRDTGVGIAPEDHEKVFEEFRQVGSSAARTEGTGLGLAISRKFIELHGGKLWLVSGLGKGSTFTFSLPRR